MTMRFFNWNIKIEITKGNRTKASEWKKYVEKGDKVNAIKAYREYMGRDEKEHYNISLKEAYDFITERMGNKYEK